MFSASPLSPRFSASRFFTACLVVLCALSLGVAGCSSAPKKKKRTVLMTEYDDARVGEEASVSVAQQMGVLADPAINAYVTEIGLKLLRGLPRRSFQYHFAVVDQEEPNAFALPGGYIFISRGLLVLANSEDELACVIGHEITHVHHRHAAAQQGLAKRGITMPWIKAGKMAAYGRDMERDADKGGQILCAAAGYDPMGMSTFLANLGQTERFRLGFSRNPGWLDSHPGSTERAAVNAIRASEIRWKRDPLLGDTQVSLYNKIEGLPYGQRPEAGVFQGDIFMHPDLDFYIRFPNGWYTQNTNSVVGAQEPRGRAIVFLTAESAAGEPQKIAEAWAAKTQETQSIDIKDSRHVKVGHLDAWRMRVNARSGGGLLTSLVTFFPYSQATWRVTAMSRAGDADNYLGRTLVTARSFRPLTEEERASIVEQTLHIVQALPEESVERLGQRTGNGWDVRATALYNGVFVDHRFGRGDLVKTLRTKPYASKQAENQQPGGTTANEGAARP
jgi:predicted Zn-dependent protease